VLLVGSGLSYHNLPKMFAAMSAGPGQAAAAADPASQAFDEWLVGAVSGSRGEALWRQLARWSSAPGARQVRRVPGARCWGRGSCWCLPAERSCPGRCWRRVASRRAGMAAGRPR
jgi:hypothetical protein